MKEKIMLMGFCLVFTVLLLPGTVSAQAWPDTLGLGFGFEGMGNMITMSPPIYCGDITGGSTEVAGGNWEMSIDDSQWPSIADPETRWNHIFNNYYTYTGTGWNAFFSAANLPEKPHWEIDTPTNGSMNGTLVILCVISDCDNDGVLDIEERMNGSFSGTLMVMKYGTSYFSKYCGSGAYNGSLSNSDPANFANDFVWGGGFINLTNCAIPTEEVSWGAMKALYK
jgi:hypothetical protein